MLSHRSAQLSILLMPVLVGLLAAACAAAPAAAPAGGDETSAYGEDSAGRPASGDEGTPAGPVPDSESGLRDGALIVYTGRLGLEVAALEPAVQAATQLVVELGGYVAGSEEQNNTSQQSASVTFRIPSQNWNEAVRGLRDLADRVVSGYTESAEVTAEVVDLEARIANLRVSETALQEIMTRAGTIDDVLKVQRELSTVRGQIEQLTAQRDNLRDRAAYGTLAVDFQTPVVAAAAAQEGWQLSVELDRAAADLIRISQALASLAIWLGIVVLPVVLPIALIAYVAYRLRRRVLPDSPPPDQVGPSM